MMSLRGVAARSGETPARRALHQIRTEALRQPSDGLGRPLPLSGVFAAEERYSPAGTRTNVLDQVDLVEDGHRLLPIFHMTHADVPGDAEGPTANELTALDYVKEHKLPLCFVSTQPERLMYDLSSYSGRAFATNPLIHNLSQEVSALAVDPLGPVSAWQDLAEDWHDNSSITNWNLETFYPDPPFVLWFSNNEANKAGWTNANSSYRYDDLYGGSTTDDEKRHRYGDGFVTVYQAFFDAFRASVVAGWQDCRFVGYNAGYTAYYGRWGQWADEGSSLHSGSGENFRLDPWHLAWDGSSPQDYLDNWRNVSDFQVWSVQVEAQNNRAALIEAQAEDPDYWNEAIFWDGLTGDGTNKRAWYTSLGQTWSATRYKGMVQFCMWLNKPRVVREYRGGLETREDIGFDYFDAILDAVDSVHENPTLRRFWRHGAIVPNSAESHPFATALPTEFAALTRWWMLTADVNPAQPWAGLTTELLVFALAFVIGEEPNRQWLVYAHSPRQDRTGVEITVPGYGDITVDVAQAGSFYLVDENAEWVTVVTLRDMGSG